MALRQSQRIDDTVGRRETLIDEEKRMLFRVNRSQSVVEDMLTSSRDKKTRESECIEDNRGHFHE